jgi:hypothetical protein
LLDHPSAEDTVRGIAEWWILERQIQRALTEVRRGLEELVKNKLVVERQRSDGQLHYRLNRRRAESARRLIAKAVKRMAT